MAINPNVVMTFAGYYVEDAGIRFHFVATNPGPGLESDYYVFCTDSELAAVSNQGQLQTLLTTKLNRSIRRTGIASKLDPFIGQSITVP